MLDCVPKLRWADLVIAMHQNVPHTFYDIPFHILMPVTEFLAKHIDGLANNLKLLDKAKENYGATFDFLQIETIFIVKE